MENLSSDMEVQYGTAGVQHTVSGQDPIPEPTVQEDVPRPNTSISDFKQVDANALYIDKTLAIKDIIDTYPTAGIFLFTRPRRFGKTFLMSTLKAFFEKPGTRMGVEATEDTSRFFRDKKIWACSEKYRMHQGQYPVVYLTFKEVKALTWEGMYTKIRRQLVMEVGQHPEILNSAECSVTDVDFMRSLCADELKEDDVAVTLEVLTRMLAMHWKAPVVVIIDEYDTPLQESYFYGFYDDARRFYGSLLSGCLKDNSYLKYAFVTGILRAAKAGIFSGLNNLSVFTTFNKKFGTYFGFTEDEVKTIAHLYGVDERYQEIFDWYEGYNFGGNRIFNPWSVLMYFSNDCEAKAYWVDTSENLPLPQLIGGAGPSAMDELLQIQNWVPGKKAIRKILNLNVIYPNMGQSSADLFSFLAMTGYLKTDNVIPGKNNTYDCDLFVPNKEVAEMFDEQIISCFIRSDSAVRDDLLVQLQSSIYNGNTARFQSALRQLLLETVGSFDLTQENSPHMFMLGLLTCLRGNYYVTSNRESGDGRYDIQLEPRRKDETGIILELKTVKNEPKRMNQTLSAAARRAVKQSQAKEYATEMKKRGIEKIKIYGVAFYHKNVVVVADKS